jgi:hypothetical protein
MKFMRGTAQCIWRDYKTSEDISSELKINPVVNFKITEGMDTTCLANDRETATLNYESKPDSPQKTSRRLMGPPQVTRPKTLQGT